MNRIESCLSRSIRSTCPSLILASCYAAVRMRHPLKKRESLNLLHIFRKGTESLSSTITGREWPVWEFRDVKAERRTLLLVLERTVASANADLSWCCWNENIDRAKLCISKKAYFRCRESERRTQRESESQEEEIDLAAKSFLSMNMTYSCYPAITSAIIFRSL